MKEVLIAKTRKASSHLRGRIEAVPVLASAFLAPLAVPSQPVPSVPLRPVHTYSIVALPRSS